MPNMHDCLDRAVAAGELDKDRAAAAKSRYDEIVADYTRSGMPVHQAQALAAQDLRTATKAATAAKAHSTIARLMAMRKLKQIIETAERPEKALLDLVENKPDSTTRTENIHWITRARQAQLRHELEGLLREAGLDAFGNSRQPALVRDIIRELHLQDSGSAKAKGFAGAVAKVREHLRQDFNARGGNIGKLEDYGVRHSHNAAAIRKAGYEAWRDAILPRIEWSRITDHSTGKPFAGQKGGLPDPAAADRFLRDVYSGIITAGWDTREPSMATGGKALYSRHSEGRVLHFKSGDDWIAYNAEFGISDPFTAMIGGLDAMARDVAVMQVFGPNPKAGLEFAIQTAEKRAQLSGDGKLVEAVANHSKRARTLLMHATGAVNEAENEARAKFFSTTRLVNVATKLGSAVLTAPSDMGTIFTGSAAMRMNPLNTLARTVKMIASSASREEAAAAGFVAETLLDMGTAAAARLGPDALAHDAAGRVSRFTIRASLLAAWTDRVRISAQFETAGHFARAAGQSFDQLDVMLRKLFERNGLTAEDWDHLRAPEALFTARNGSKFLAPFWWLEHQTSLPPAQARDLAIRLQGAIEDNLELFVPSKRLRGSAAVLGETKPGSWGGEFLRSTIGFKNYPISLTIGQIALFNSLPTPASKALVIASIVAGSTLLGALSVQLKELAKGRDPRPMTDGRFWIAAMLQGGGLGIFGDFLYSNTNRFGSGLAETLAGPVVSTIGDAATPIIANAYRAGMGEKTFFGRDVANFIRYNTPVASSLWYTRLAFDRLVADLLQAFLDPEASKIQKQQERKQLREYGNASWWPRGSRAPQRWPNPKSAVRQK